MKRLFIILTACLPLACMAQNTWEETPSAAAEKPTGQPAAQVNPDAKYLAGAVPVVDGKVAFTVTISAPGKSAQQVYDIVGRELSRIAKEPNQYEQSRLVVADTATHQIIGSFQERMVFKSTALQLDYTRFYYFLMADCQDGQARLTLTRIHYLYEEEREPQHLMAEDWITDENAVRKKGDKLAPITGKFRRKTIDRKDELFERLKTQLAK